MLGGWEEVAGGYNIASMKSIRTSTVAAAFVVALVAFGAASAQATRLVRPFEVVTSSGPGDAAFASAMRIALVRATGRRDAERDPAYASLIADARRYVQQFQPANPGPGISVVFDAAAIERAILAAGGRLWPRERPVVLVVLLEPPAAMDPAVARKLLEDTASFRGLPVTVVTGAQAGLAAGDSGSEALLAAARRAGADTALIGRAAGDAEDDSWQWSLATPRGLEAFGGTLAGAIHSTADSIAAAAEDVSVQPELETLVELQGVRTLRDYAQAARLLSGLPGVINASVIEATGGSAVFRVIARGGSDGLAGTLAASARLRSVSADGRRLVYQFLGD